jgi:hypothetical protein
MCATKQPESSTLAAFPPTSIQCEWAIFGKCLSVQPGKCGIGKASMETAANPNRGGERRNNICRRCVFGFEPFPQDRTTSDPFLDWEGCDFFEKRYCP